MDGYNHTNHNHREVEQRTYISRNHMSGEHPSAPVVRTYPRVTHFTGQPHSITHHLCAPNTHIHSFARNPPYWHWSVHAHTHTSFPINAAVPHFLSLLFPLRIPGVSPGKVFNLPGCSDFSWSPTLTREGFEENLHGIKVHSFPSC